MNLDTIHTIAPDLEYSAEFVPWDGADKYPTLNWRVTFRTARGKMTTSFTQGIGHAPNYQHGRHDIDYDYYLKRIARTGRNCKGKLPAPNPADVMCCLLSDAEAIDCACFEDWATDLGYDTDSRKVEGIYRACLSTGLRLRMLLGEEKMTALHELLKDL